MKKDAVDSADEKPSKTHASHASKAEDGGKSHKKSKSKKSRKKQEYPWKSPWRIAFFIAALVFALFVIVNMPAVQKKKWAYNSTSNSMIEKGSQEKAEENILGKSESVEQAVQTKELKEAQLEELARQPKEAQLAKQAQAPISEEPPRKHKSSEKSAFEKIMMKAKSIGKLLLMVGIAAFLGGLMEARSWHLYFGYFLRNITRAARLPEVIGVSMPIALYSNVGANSVLMSSHTDGTIPTSALITGGMANSYLSHMSHSLRVIYPVIALIGLPGLLFFGVQFFGGFLVIFMAFCINRYKYRHMTPDEWTSEFSSQSEVLSWKKSINLGLMRSSALIFRMIYITVPLMLGVEWLIKTGAFDFWDQYIPIQVAKYFPAELMSIVVAQIGGLVQSAGVSANLYAEGLVHESQILLAMLVASAVGNPIRTLRRNLPSALGVYPPKVAFTIVFTMQFARFIITLLGSLGVMMWMNLFLF